MKLNIQSRRYNQKALWTDGVTGMAATGMCFYRMGPDLRPLGRRYWVGSWIERILSVHRLPRQFLRVGIHHLWPLGGGGFLAVIRKRALRVEEDGRVKEVLRFPRGNKPAHKGVCVTPDGTVFMGEYALNFDRKMPVVLYRSRNGGRSFEAIHEFKPGAVRHIHFVQWDPVDCCLWLGTGDTDAESRMFRSRDNGDSWEPVGGGSQLWRAVGVAFRPDALYWGTDAGSDAGLHPNHIMRWDRQTGQMEKVREVQGPCHGVAVLRDGTLLISTGVEGGVNEKDRAAHLWVSRDGRAWHDVMCVCKDRWPLIIQYGVLRLPWGLEQGEKVLMTGLGLAGAEETTWCGTLNF